MPNSSARSQPDARGYGPHPFAIGQEKPFQTGPWLGGFIYVLTASVLAGGTVTIAHPLRVVPRAVEVLAAGTTYPSRVAQGATWTRASAAVVFESAQPAGTVLFLY